MKRFLILCAVALAACTTAPSQPDLETMAANAKTQITQACAVVQPTLLNLQASMPTDPNLPIVVKLNGELCTSALTLDPTNVQQTINVLIPQTITAVGLLPIDPGTKTAIQIGLGAASVALSNWLLVYGQQHPTVTK